MQELEVCRQMPKHGFPGSDGPILPEINFRMCPIAASLGTLGKKWALMVLRDLVFLHSETFSQILRHNKGMTPRILSIRLKELQKAGIIEKVVNPRAPRDIRYRLTQKGAATAPILTAFIQYGIRYHADRVFEDKTPRQISQVFPGRQEILLGPLMDYAAQDVATR